MTDFFEHQDRARARSGKLLTLFVLAILVMIGLIYSVGMLFVVAGESSADTMQGAPSFFNPGLLGLVTAAVLLVVLGGAAYRSAELSGGGEVVARSLGGRLLNLDTARLEERRILNVVEEMAIASGVPAPPVYLLDEEMSINAFAAGYRPEDAVIGVSRGAVECLTRDELQGVMAHEFSHILNGDMRLNIRLTGLVFGIVLISTIGHVLLRSIYYGSFGRRRSKEDEKAVIAILVIAIALIVIGSLGALMGNIIKAAISRQREFLADASAVQFTRYPDGIGNALRKIGGLSQGTRGGKSDRSKLKASHAHEYSHMYFANGVSNLLGASMATHPPLGKRLQQILPQWDGSFLKAESIDPTDGAEAERGSQSRRSRRRTGLPGLGVGLPGMGRPGDLTVGLAGATEESVATGSPAVGDGPGMGDRIAAARMASRGQANAITPNDSGLDRAGQIDPEHVAYAQQLLANVPESVREASRDLSGARAVVCGLLLDGNDTLRQTQLQAVARDLDDEVAEYLEELLGDLARVLPEARLPLVDLCLGTLRRLTLPQYEELVRVLDHLAGADQRIDLFEWTLARAVRRHVGAQFEKHRAGSAARTGSGVGKLALKRCSESLNVVLSALSYAGSRTAEAATQTHRVGAEAAHRTDLRLLDPQSAGLSQLDEALTRLAQLRPTDLKTLVVAMARTITSDGQVTLMEAELMRALSDSLGVPIPPLLPGQKLV